MSFKLWPLPGADLKAWAHALVRELGATQVGVSPGVIGVAVGKIPEGWRTLQNTTGLPALTDGMTWIIKE